MKSVDPERNNENPLVSLLGSRNKEEKQNEELLQSIDNQTLEIKNTFESLMGVSKELSKTDILIDRTDLQTNKIGLFQGEINERVHKELDKLRYLLGGITFSAKGIAVYLLKSIYDGYKRWKQARKDVKREDELSLRQMTATALVGDVLAERLMNIEDILISGFSDSSKTKEEQIEEQSFTRSLFEDLGKSIRGSISGLMIKPKPEEGGWLGMLLKPLILVGAAYIFRTFKVFQIIYTTIKGLLSKSKTFVSFFEKIGRFFGGFFSKIGGFFGRIFKPISGVMGKLGKFFGWLGKFLKPVFGILGKVGKFFKAVPILGQVITVIEGIVGFFRGFFGTEGSFFDKMIGGIKGIFAQILSGLTFGFISFEDVMGWFDTASEYLGDFFYMVYKFFARTIPNVFTKVIDSIFGFFGETLPNFFTETLPNFFTETIPNAIKNLLSLLPTYIKDAIRYIFGIDLGGRTANTRPASAEELAEMNRDPEKFREAGERYNLVTDTFSGSDALLKEKIAQMAVDSSNEVLNEYIKRYGTNIGENALAQFTAIQQEMSNKDRAGSTTVQNVTNVTTNNNNSLGGYGEMEDATDRRNMAYVS